MILGNDPRSPAGRYYLALYVWDYTDRMELMRYFWDTAVHLHGQARDDRVVDLDPGAVELWETGAPRRSVGRTRCVRCLKTAVFVRLESARSTFLRSLPASRVRTPFLGGQGPAPGYAVSLPDDHRSEPSSLSRAGFHARPTGPLRWWRARGPRAIARPPSRQNSLRVRKATTALYYV